MGHFIDSSVGKASLGPIMAYPKIVEPWRDWSVVTKDRMIFDLVDLFGRNLFRLIKSNHFLPIDYRFLPKKRIILWILDKVVVVFYKLLTFIVICSRNQL